MELAAAAGLARRLIVEHELADWLFEFDHARSRFGLCSHRDRTISLSRHLVALNGEPEVRDTILHEIAHAKAGYRAAHGPRWRAIAKAIGCKPRACFDHKSVLTPERPWVGTCPNCADTIHRHRRLDKVLACAKCCRRYAKNRFDRRFVFVWRRRSENAPTPAPVPVAVPKIANVPPPARTAAKQLLFTFVSRLVGR